MIRNKLARILGNFIKISVSISRLEISKTLPTLTTKHRTKQATKE